MPVSSTQLRKVERNKMSSIRKAKRKAAIAAAKSPLGKLKGDKLYHAVAKDDFRAQVIEEVKPLIEWNIESAYSMMVMWCLYNDFDFGKEELQKLCKSMKQFHDDLKDKRWDINLDMAMDVLAEECDLHFSLPEPIPGEAPPIADLKQEEFDRLVQATEDDAIRFIQMYSGKSIRIESRTDTCQISLIDTDMETVLDSITARLSQSRILSLVNIFLRECQDDYPVDADMKPIKDII